jgi:25S rRNA (uracil2634-N3)-methyltransferase
VNSSTTSLIPFKPTDRVLLLGEGDFSFSRSLVRHHGIHHLTATSYDSEASVVEKYPQVRENVGFLRSQGVVVAHGVDAGGAHKVKAVRKRRGEMAPKIPSDGDDDGEEQQGKAGREDACGFNVIGFMFPHVGGKSTDMDRQIHANQRLSHFPLSFFYFNQPPSKLMVFQSYSFHSSIPRNNCCPREGRLWLHFLKGSTMIFGM